MPDDFGNRLVNEPPAQSDKPFVIMVEEDDCVVLDGNDLDWINFHLEEIASQVRFFSLVVPRTTMGNLNVIREQIERIAARVGIEAPRWGRP